MVPNDKKLKSSSGRKWKVLYQPPAQIPDCHMHIAMEQQRAPRCSPSRQCSYLMACLYVTGNLSKLEDVLKMKKTSFQISSTIASRRLLKGSHKTPSKKYQKDPSLQHLVTPIIIEKALITASPMCQRSKNFDIFSVQKGMSGFS